MYYTDTHGSTGGCPDLPYAAISLSSEISLLGTERDTLTHDTDPLVYRIYEKHNQILLNWLLLFTLRPDKRGEIAAVVHQRARRC